MAAQLHKKAKDREIAPHLHSVNSEITHFLCVCAFLSEFTIDWLTTDLLLFPSKLPSLLIHLVLLPIWETLSRLWKFWKEKGCNPPGKKKRKRVCLAPFLPFYFCRTPVNTLVILVSELNIFINLPFTLPCWGYEPTEEKLLGKESLELISYTHLPPLSLV